LSFRPSAQKYPGIEIIAIKDRIILPGFIDGHVHFPQVRVLGAFGEQLLNWLKFSIFPEEIKYRDREYAKDGARHFFDAMLSSGTTTCQAFTTSWAVPTEEFFEEATRRDMRVIGGLPGIDRNAPEEFMLRVRKAIRPRHSLQVASSEAEPQSWNKKRHSPPKDALSNPRLLFYRSPKFPLDFSLLSIELIHTW
jgi:cytosine/adenosine deaminase-related metal-dependent hydrolase